MNTPLNCLMAILAGLLAATPSVHAQPATSGTAGTTSQVGSVEVEGLRSARQDVATVCPMVQQELPESLASAWQRVGRAGDVQVLFTVDGDKVTQARALSGLPTYRRRVASAVRDLGCRSDRAAPQHFLLTVRFVDPLDAAARPAKAGVVALLQR